MAPICWLLLELQYFEALVLFFIAGASDGLDGWLAKRYGWTSRLGAILDPLADKIMLVSSFVVLAWNGLVPVWLLALVIGRDLIIVLGAIWHTLFIARVESVPSLISKLNTLLQIVLVLLLMVTQLGDWLDKLWVDWLIIAVAVTTICSGLHYALYWSRRLRLKT